ncbi:MAG TPA: O-antigen ligase family protein [Gaiellaceae bacterium]|nr:O-antigen ligase family protein [Gaiellaceae bacterium]
MTGSYLESTARLAAPWLLAAAAALLAGAIAAGEVESRYGSAPAFFLLAALLGGSFVIVFAFLGSLAIVVWPVAATVGYLIQIPSGQPVITFDRIWIGGMVAYIALNRRTVERSPFTQPLALGFMLLVVAYGLRAVTTSATLDRPVGIWIDAILLPAILFVACERYCLNGTTHARRLTGALMLAGGVLGAIGIAQRIWGFELATLTGGFVRYDVGVDQTRISGPYPAPEPYALSLLICLAATLFWIQSRDLGRRYSWAILLMGMQVAAILLTLFRAAWIGVIVIVVAAFGIRPGRIGRMFAVVTLVGILAFIASPQLLQNETIATRTRDTDNISGRLATYEQGFRMFLSEPLFGVGVERYHEVAERLPPETVAGVQSVTFAHSSYVGLLAEQGIVGFLPFLLLTYGVWVLVRGLRAASAANREALFLTACVAGASLAYLVMSLTLTMLPYAPSNAFFAALLGAASGRLDALLGARETSPTPGWRQAPATAR